MPFGKFKGKEICAVPNHYWEWLMQQDWVEKEWPGIWKYINGEAAAGTEESNAPPAMQEGEDLSDPSTVPF